MRWNPARPGAWRPRRHNDVVGAVERAIRDRVADALPEIEHLDVHPFDFALVCMLGLLGLRIFEMVGADIDDLGEEHGHRVLRVTGNGGRVVLVPLPPAVGRAVDRAAADRTAGPLLLNRRGVRMDRHAATRQLRRLATEAGGRLPRMHPHSGTPW
jgi:integrase/recombinase XerD